MNNLIKLAKEKGFKPISLTALGVHNYSDTYSNDSIELYIWMCELQKWLRDDKNIEIDIEYDNNDFGDKIYKSNIWDGKEDSWLNKGKFSFKSGCYEQTLKSSLIESLRLI